MQVNSAQDYLTMRKRQILGATYQTDPPPQKRRSNEIYTSVVGNGATQRERFVAPFQGAQGGASGGATYSSKCCLDFPPTLTNLTVSSGSGTSTQTLTWSEYGPIGSRTVVFTSGSGTVGTISAGSVTLTSLSIGTPTVVVTLISPSGLSNTASAGTINLSNPCFLGFVPLMTRMGAIAAKYIEVGMEMLQPNGTFSRVLGVKVATVTHGGDTTQNDRLFADDDEKMVVTYWHKIRFDDEDEEVKAGEHPNLHEVFREFPFDVYNFVLESYKDKLLVADTNIIAESFVPVNPA
jgi:hypothetical protein